MRSPLLVANFSMFKRIPSAVHRRDECSLHLTYPFQREGFKGLNPFKKKNIPLRKAHFLKVFAGVYVIQSFNPYFMDFNI